MRAFYTPARVCFPKFMFAGLSCNYPSVHSTRLSLFIKLSGSKDKIGNLERMLDKQTNYLHSTRPERAYAELGNNGWNI